MPHNRDVVIVSACRTPIGSFNGSLGGVSAARLGAVVIAESLRRTGIAPAAVSEVIFGCVLTAGLGQNVARQASIGAGIPATVPAETLNMVCGSGMRAVIRAAQAIRCGEAEIVVAGGTENMTAAGHVLPGARQGFRLGPAELVDSLLTDGLTDALTHVHMGITAEDVAARYAISREQADRFALESQAKAERAIKAGRFVAEIVPVSVPQKRGGPVDFTGDEHPRFEADMTALSRLRPAFREGGVVTAGNSSGINDGAAALVLMSAAAALDLGLRPLATIRSSGVAGVDPEVMGLASIPATLLALSRAGLTVGDLDLIEANEDFATQCLAVAHELGLPPERLNVNGGAIALGHPIGASGARILVTLLHEMPRRGARLGLATLCIGGGMGAAVVVEC